jgi:CheY-like chemotaxis protein
MATKQVPMILLVEDSEDDAYFFQRALNKSGRQGTLKQVSDGGAAIKLLLEALSDASRIPDLVFLDLKLPVMSGFEVLAWIRRQQFADPLSVIVLTGSDQEADRLRALELGASELIVKPITASDLADRLQNLTAMSAVS